MNEESKDGLRNVYYLSIARLEDKFTKAIMAPKILSFSSNLDLFLIRPKITIMPAPEPSPAQTPCSPKCYSESSSQTLMLAMPVEAITTARVKSPSQNAELTPILSILQIGRAHV